MRMVQIEATMKGTASVPQGGGRAQAGQEAGAGDFGLVMAEVCALLAPAPAAPVSQGQEKAGGDAEEAFAAGPQNVNLADPPLAPGDPEAPATAGEKAGPVVLPGPAGMMESSPQASAGAAAPVKAERGALISDVNAPQKVQAGLSGERRFETVAGVVSVQNLQAAAGPLKNTGEPEQPADDPGSRAVAVTAMAGDWDGEKGIFTGGEALPAAAAEALPEVQPQRVQVKVQAVPFAPEYGLRLALEETAGPVQDPAVNMSAELLRQDHRLEPQNAAGKGNYAPGKTTGDGTVSVPEQAGAVGEMAETVYFPGRAGQGSTLFSGKETAGPEQEGTPAAGAGPGGQKTWPAAAATGEA
ncbi:MAG: hypothetical protein K6T29_09025, partial [Peptococcaceae bacterium]|nr:hypothetical protein [Peptococcaceae bacterium]